MQRVHLSPPLGELDIIEITTAHVDALVGVILSGGRSPKTIRNVVSFLHSVLEHAIDRGWARETRYGARPVRGAVATATRTPICSSSRSKSSTR
jgi:hypothetical protein